MDTVLAWLTGTASSGAAARGDGAFSSQLLADVLCAAFSTKRAMRDFVQAVKAKNEAFKSVQLSSKADGPFSNTQIAEGIAECKPDQVTDAGGLLSWLIKEKLLKKNHLETAMDSVGLQHVTRDTVADLCKKITTSWPRTRREIPSQTAPSNGLEHSDSESTSAAAQVLPQVSAAGRDGAAAASASASTSEAAGSEAGTASSGAAARGDGAFSSQLLADVLCAALPPTKVAMRDFVQAVKAKNEAFKSVQLSSKADGPYSNTQIAERIAECKPDQVTDAEGLLSWLIKEKLLKKDHLETAMKKVGLRPGSRDTVDHFRQQITTLWPRTPRGIHSQTGEKRALEVDAPANEEQKGNKPEGQPCKKQRIRKDDDDSDKKNSSSPVRSDGGAATIATSVQGKRDSAWCKLLFDDGTEEECLGQDFKIGRHTSNNYHVENEGYLSSSHCYLTAPVRWGALPTLTDTSSGNGTYVNGEKLVKSTQELKWGERIEVVKGNKSLCFVLSQVSSHHIDLGQTQPYGDTLAYDDPDEKRVDSDSGSKEENATAGALAGGEGGAARPDNVLRGAFGGGAPLRAPLRENETAGALAGGEGGAARPDNVLRGAFGGGAPPRAPRSLSPAPSDAALMETGGLVVPSSQKKAKKRPAGGEVNSKIPDGAELHRAVLEFIRNTVAWEEMPLGDFRRKLEQQLNLNEGELNETLQQTDIDLIKTDHQNPDEGNDDDDDQNESNDAGAVEGGGPLDESVDLPNLPEEDVDLPKPVAQGTGPQMSVLCKHCGESHRAYEKQCEVAMRLFDEMQKEIKKSGGFRDFELFILVPNLNSLYKQTVNRLHDFILETRKKEGEVKTEGSSKDHRAFLAGREPAARVFKSSLRAKTNKDIHAIMEQRIKEEKDTLFLLIHDEAHYEATRSDKDNAVNKFINSETVLNSSNVLTLLVSATPYNLVSQNTRIPAQNVVDWMKDEEDQDASEYFGLNKFVKRSLNPEKHKFGYIDADEEFETRVSDKTLPTLRVTRNTGEKEDKKEREANKVDGIRCDLLTKDYISGMEKFADQSFANADSASTKVSKHTLKIVKDLLNVENESGARPFPPGKGCMVLVRVTSIKLGKDMAAKLRKERDRFGYQQRFAILLDVEEKLSGGGIEKMLKDDSSKKSEEFGWLNRLRLINDKPESYKPESYEDLKDLPVILILCEKGKMGDTFPKSLRYYDLRMRYANSCEIRAPVEQDLGRAFRYGPGTDEYPFPIVLVGAKCARQLRGEGLRSQQLIKLDPDYPSKITSLGKTKVLPKTEFTALNTYRSHWKANHGHYDYENNTQNARRFLLVGRPQIGKTGAFLHLVYLLWREYGREVELPEPEDVEPPDAMPEDPDQDQPPVDKEEQEINMDLYPNFRFMSGIEFRDEPNPGKYGDPTDKELISWYLNLDPMDKKLTEKCRGLDCKEHRHFQKEIHEKAKKSTTAAPDRVEITTGLSTHRIQGNGTLATPQSAPGKGLAASANQPNKREETLDSRKSRYPHKRCKGTEGRSKNPNESLQKLTKRLGYTSKTLPDIGTLHVPANLEKWFDDEFKLKDRSKEKMQPGWQCVSIPIFLPSRGRAKCKKCKERADSGRCNCGFLDLESSMKVSGQVEGGMGKVGEKCEYIQILVVIQEEVEDYVQFGPQNALIFALPDTAKDWGVGFSRNCTKKLADRICPPSFPFCLMMDDSVQYWRGITLPGDPHKPFGQDAKTGDRAAALRTDISLADMLLYFQKGLLDESCELNKFGIIGFHRLNGWEASKRAYNRTHCTSTVLLNLGKLKEVKDVNYLKEAWVWEDLQFNRDAEEHGAVICKCYRFAFSSPQLREGGCSDMVARSEVPTAVQHQPPAFQSPKIDAASKGGAPKPLTTPVESENVKVEVEGMLVLKEGSARTQPPLPPTERLDEKEESGLSKMLTELNLAEYLTLESPPQEVDINILKETLKHGGREALERLLEEVGVDKAVHRHRIANHLQGEYFRLM